MAEVLLLPSDVSEWGRTVSGCMIMIRPKFCDIKELCDRVVGVRQEHRNVRKSWGPAKLRSRFKWTSNHLRNRFYPYLSSSHPGEPDEPIGRYNANGNILS